MRTATAPLRRGGGRGKPRDVHRSCTSRPQPSHLAAAAARVQAAADERAADLDDWVEREARREGSWLVAELAAGTDDRRAPPAPDAATDPFAGREAPATSYAARTGTEPEAAGSAGPTPLPSMRAVISTATRYLTAAKRVDHALLTLADAYREQAREPAWSSADMHRVLAAGEAADAIDVRLQRMRDCVQGVDRVPVFVCRCCQQRKLGVPMSCNSRVCPRCCRKVRAQNQRTVHELLERVDDRRRARGVGPARYRFVTLTLPSSQTFLGGRHRLAAAWSRLHRSDVWRDVGACVGAFETTHTAHGWHVHLHAIVDAYLPRPLLCRRWAHAGLALAVAATAESTGRRAAAAAALLVRWFASPRRDGRGRAVPVTWGGLRADAAFRELPGLERWQDLEADAVVEPRHLRDAALAAGARLASSRRERIEARWQLRNILRQVPRAAAQHVRGTAGDRAQVVHELAKYVGKDLGGAGVDDAGAWGVAGTAARLAEFIDGVRRWRALRTYGEAYDARLREQREPMTCDACGEADLEFEESRPLSAAAIAQLRAQRQQSRRIREQRERPPPAARTTRRVAAPRLEADEHLPQHLRDGLAWWQGLHGCVTSTVTV